MSDTGNAIKSAEAMMRHCAVDQKFAPAILAGTAPKTIYQDLSVTWRANIVRGNAATKLWRAEGRQTLAIHPEVVREVSKASSSKFPAEILRAIPYINPMVVFSDPPVLKTWRERTQASHLMPYTTDEASLRLIGYFVYGQKHGAVATPESDAHEHIAMKKMAGIVTSTHAPDAQTIGMTAIFEVLDTAGNRLDMEAASFSLPLQGDYTLAQLVEDQVERFSFAVGSRTDGDVAHELKKTWVTEVYKILVGTMLYLCSTVLDAERVPTVTTKHLAKTIARKPLSFYRVGWTLGAALTKYRQAQYRGEGSQQGDITHQQDPQHRKCHFRMQWYGPRAAHACDLMRNTCDCDGRHREWIFIAPYWTHRERLGVAGTNTVRRVPKTG